jgi:hypothetical protein
MSHLFVSKNLELTTCLLLILLIALGSAGCATKTTMTPQAAATSAVVTAAPAATSTAALEFPQGGPVGPGGSRNFASVAPTYKDLAYATVSSG